MLQKSKAVKEDRGSVRCAFKLVWSRNISLRMRCFAHLSKKFEEVGEVSHIDIWKKRIPGRR